MRRAREGGFTVIELMIVVALLAVLAVFAAPNMREFILDNRIKSQTANVISQMNEARAEAMRTGKQVTICPSSTATGCSGSSWEVGWIAFVDDDEDETLDKTGQTIEETIVLTGSQLSGGNTLRSSTFTTYIAFGPDGGTIGSQSGAFSLCDSRDYGEKARAIRVTATGRARSLAADASGSGISSCP